MQKTVKWRMTLQELCYLTKATPPELDEWAELGALGPRWKEPRDRGRWRHISREAAQRAVIMRHLLDMGLQPRTAAAIASVHQRGDLSDLHATMSGVEVRIKRSEIDLP